MLLRKQTVWLLTMLSLVAVLSVYYITSPQETTVNQEANEETKSGGDENGNADQSTIVSNESNDSAFEAMRMDLNDERSKEKEELTEKVASSDLSEEERVEAHGQIEELDELSTKEDMLESMIVALDLPKNQCIREETMPTEKYLELFYPFDKLNLVKKGIESSWNINEDRTMQALALTFSEQPMAMNMSFQRQYAERYDWLTAQFKDWAFHLLTSFFYYEDNASLKDEAKKTLHMSMAAFGGILTQIGRASCRERV